MLNPTLAITYEIVIIVYSHAESKSHTITIEIINARQMQQIFQSKTIKPQNTDTEHNTRSFLLPLPLNITKLNYYTNSLYLQNILYGNEMY